MPKLQLKIAESPSAELSIEKYSPERFPEFQDLFAARDWDAKKPLEHLLRKPHEASGFTGPAEHVIKGRDDSGFPLDIPGDSGQSECK
jgi:hypothetical protein